MGPGIRCERRGEAKRRSPAGEAIAPDLSGASVAPAWLPAPDEQPLGQQTRCHMSSKSRSTRMSGFYGHLLLGNVVAVPLMLLMGSYAGAAVNAAFAVVMWWWAHRL